MYVLPSKLCHKQFIVQQSEPCICDFQTLQAREKNVMDEILFRMLITQAIVWVLTPD